MQLRPIDNNWSIRPGLAACPTAGLLCRSSSRDPFFTVLLPERRPTPSSTYLHDPDTRETLLDGPLGAILRLGTETSDGHFSLLEHPLAPRALGALVHTHRNEDEYSLVLEGTICVEVGGQTFEAGPGSVVAKPRGVPHAFSNATHFLSREAVA